MFGILAVEVHALSAPPYNQGPVRGDTSTRVDQTRIPPGWNHIGFDVAFIGECFSNGNTELDAHKPAHIDNVKAQERRT